MRNLLLALAATTSLAAAAPAFGQSVGMRSTPDLNLAGFNGQPDALPRAVSTIEKLSGGRVAEIRFDNESFEAVARTNFDVRGHMMPDAPPSGFQKVSIAISVKSDAAPEKLAEIERLALNGCPGIATLRDPVAVETALTVAPAARQAAVA